MNIKKWWRHILSSEKWSQLINRTHLSPEVHVTSLAPDYITHWRADFKVKSVSLERDDLLLSSRHGEIGAKARWSQLIWYEGKLWENLPFTKKIQGNLKAAKCYFICFEKMNLKARKSRYKYTELCTFWLAFKSTQFESRPENLLISQTALAVFLDHSKTRKSRSQQAMTASFPIL
jgi:hypothetical protein